MEMLKESAEFGIAADKKDQIGPMKAQVKLTPQGQKQQMNTLAVPALYAAIYPQRLGLVDDQPIDLASDYNPDLIERLTLEYQAVKLGPKPLREGYLYLFVEGCLYHEYKVTLNSEKKALFQRVDLSTEQGKDNRQVFKGLQMPFVLAPIMAEKVELCFSAYQFSWLRINALGGLPDVPWYDGEAASNQDVLAINDIRLTNSTNSAALLKLQEEQRAKRLLDITYQANKDYLEWQRLDQPGRQSQPFIQTINGAFIPNIAKSDNLFLEQVVTDTCVCVLNDHSDIIKQLCLRVNHSISLMAKLLDDLQNPSHQGDKANLFPNAEYFASASFIHKELIAKGSESNKNYLQNNLRSYRDYVKFDDIKATLGVHYREKAVELINIAKSSLEQFLYHEHVGGQYPSLISQFEKQWYQEVLDLFACDSEMQRLSRSENDKDEPVLEVALEIIGGVFSSLGVQSRGLDITLDGSVQDIDDYKEKAKASRGASWIVDMVDEKNELWMAIVNGKPSYVRQSCLDAKGDNSQGSLINPALLDTSRRAIIAFSTIFQNIGQVAPFKIGEFGSRKEHLFLQPLQRWVGIKFERNPLFYALEDKPVDKVITSKSIADHGRESASALLLSTFFRTNKPKVLDKLGGLDQAAIQQKRGQERERMLTNQENNKQAYLTQWENKERKTHIDAEDIHAENKAKLVAEDNANKQAIIDHREETKLNNLSANDQIAKMEKEQAGLKRELDEASDYSKKTQAEWDAVNKHQTSLQNQRIALQKQYDALRTQEKRLAKTIKQSSADSVKQAENIDRYYREVYSSTSAHNAVSEFLSAEQLKLDNLKQQQDSVSADRTDLDKKIAVLDQQVEQNAKQLSDVSHKLGTANQQAIDAENKFDSLNQSISDARSRRDVAADQARKRLDELIEIDKGYQTTKQNKANESFSDLRKAKAQATAQKERQIHALNADNENAVRRFDEVTEQQLQQRLADEKAHQEANKKAAAKAKKNNEIVFDLSDETDRLAWEKYQLLDQADAGKPVMYTKETNNYRQLIEAQAEVRERVRASDVANTNQIVDPQKVAKLNNKEKKLLQAAILDPQASRRYKEMITNHSVIMINPKASNGTLKTVLGNDARQMLEENQKVLSSITSIVAAVEIINVYSVLSTYDWGKSGYHKVNLLSGILDFAATIEATAGTMGALDKGLIAANAAGSQGQLWKFFIRGGINIAASAVTTVVFAWDLWEAVVRDHYDDAMYAYGTLTLGSLFVLGGSITSFFGVLGVLTAPFLVMGVITILVGAIMLHWFFMPNDDLLAYVLGHGPFGVDGRFGNSQASLSLSNDKKSIRVRLRGKDYLWLEGDKYVLRDIHKGLSLAVGNHVVDVYEEDTHFIENSDGSYDYQTENGVLPIGKVGEPLAGGKFNDPADIEQYFKSSAQIDSEERFGTDLYTDGELAFQVKAADWQEEGVGPKRYFESLISAFYPIELAVDVVSKGHEYWGKTKRYYGNLMKIKYRIPFYRAGQGEVGFFVAFNSDNSNPTKINIISFAKKHAPYIKVLYLDEGWIEVNIDLDNTEFHVDQKLASTLTRGNTFEYKVELYCDHRIEGQTNSYKQPPAMSLKKENYAQKVENYTMIAPSA